jgi:hypothetical protein
MTTDLLRLAPESLPGVPADVPVFDLGDIDGDLVADLRAIGVAVHLLETDPEGADAVHVAAVQAPRESAQIDALASTLLRRMSALDLDVARHATAYALEQEALRARFERRIGALRIERERLEAFARHLARVQHDRNGFGKKRSRDTGYGTYGVRAIPSKVEVADEATFVAWAETEAPGALRLTIKLSLEEARQFFTADELARWKPEVLVTTVRELVNARAVAADAIERDGAPIEDGALDPERLRALPPGVVRTPEGLETYAKPLPLPSAGRGA